MEPINVDFTKGKKDGGEPVNEVYIPVKHSVRKILINLALTVVFGLIAYYVMIPALNPKAIELYIYIACVCLIYLGLTVLSTKVAVHPEYTPYLKKRARIPGIIIGIVAIVCILGYIVGAQIFRAHSYSHLITVEDGDFTEDVAEIDFSSVPTLDSTSATNLAVRTLGDLSDMVSQFVVSTYSTQINYKNTPVRVYSLAYGDVFKWLKNTRKGLPAYIIVDMTNQKSEIVRLDKGMKYSPSEYLNHYLLRHLRFKYPTYLFGEPSFEIDEQGQPFWIVPILDKTIGLFGGTDVIGAVVVNAIDGSCNIISTSPEHKTKLPTGSFVTDENWQWIDHVYSAQILNDQYNYYGKLSNGFINSIIGQEGVKVTSSGYNYLALNDDVYMYTGVTSISSDQSIIGFVLLNQRTKETHYYPISGALENTAMTSAEGKVQQYSYNATFPLLLNISGEPTYFVALKDSSELVKMYAMVNVKQSTIVGIGANLTECTENYAAELKSNGIHLDIDIDSMAESDSTADAPSLDEITGVITEIRSVVTGGETYFYLKLNSSASYYKLSAANAEKVVILNIGDTVTVSFEAGSDGDIITAKGLV
ncbi:MAG: CvpA family protein [Ruminococcaceae bacterium]|nr:CvpA family protein [Oscillospiraceae bacterium]